jgi:hypothetical protein
LQTSSHPASWSIDGDDGVRDHLDALSSELDVELVAVVRLVPNQLLGKRLQEALYQGVFDELRFMSRTTRNPAGERKTIVVGHCHDLGQSRLAAAVLLLVLAFLLALVA